MPFSRREFLNAMLVSLAASASGWPTRVSADRHCPLNKIIVDAHSHVFNARDIPLEGFADRVLGERLGFLGWIGKAIIYFAKILGDTLQEVAPGYGDEMERLDQLLKEFPNLLGKKLRDEPQAAEYYRLLRKNFQNLDKNQRDAIEYEFARDFNKTAGELYYSTQRGEIVNFSGSELEELNELLSKPPFVDQEGLFLDFLLTSEEYENRQLERAKQGLGPDGLEPLKLKLYGEVPSGGFTQMLKQMAQFRYLNAINLITAYPAVDVFVTATVDFYHWLGPRKPYETSSVEQISLLSRISKLVDGKIIGMAGYNPWSNIITKGNHMSGIDDGIQTKGIVGVKLYPPMGFQPWGNTFRDAEKDWWPPGAPSDFGKALDADLAELYAYCIDEDAAILAHCNDSLGAGDDYGDRAHPKYWNEALSNKEFNSLRISLGHSGGYRKVIRNKRWFQEVVKFAANPKFENAYFDFSNFDWLRYRYRREELGLHMNALFTVPGTSALMSKLLYGSDWYMLISEKEYEKYVCNFQTMLREAGMTQGGTHQSAIMGGNAVRFLGLDSGKNFNRLEQFFGRDTPYWFDKLH